MEHAATVASRNTLGMEVFYIYLPEEIVALIYQLIYLLGAKHGCADPMFELVAGIRIDEIRLNGHRIAHRLVIPQQQKTRFDRLRQERYEKIMSFIKDKRAARDSMRNPIYIAGYTVGRYYPTTEYMTAR